MGNIHKLDKKVLLYEGGKSLHIDDEITKTGLHGALRVMQHLGMRNFENELTEGNAVESSPIIIQNSTWIRAGYSGMMHPYIAPGEKVEKGTVLGSISDPFGSFERAIKSQFSGYVICVNQSPIVNQGDGIFHISKE